MFYTVGRPLIRVVLFYLRSSVYQLGCTVAAVSAQWPAEHVKNKVCIKSLCTVGKALLALIEVHRLLIQTLLGIGL